MYLNGHTRLRYRKKSRPAPRLAVIGLAGVLALLFFLRPQPVASPVPALSIPTPLVPTAAPLAGQAEAELAAGQLDEATVTYRQAIRAEPRNLEFYVALARLQAYQQSPAEALQTANTAILIDPESSQAFAVQALALYGQGRLDAAAQAVIRAIGLDPRNALAHAYYAQILVAQQQLEQAGQEARLALSLQPGSLEAHYAYGQVMETLGDTQGAAQEYEAAVAVNPNLAFVRVALGRVYGGRLAKYDAAIENFRAAAALTPRDPGIFREIARMYAHLGDFDRASEYAAQALELDPSDAALQGLLGSLYYFNGEYEAAVEPLRLAVEGGMTREGIAVAPLAKDSPGTAEAYYSYAMILIRQTRCNRAQALFSDILANWPDDEIMLQNVSEGQRLCQDASGTEPASG